MKSKVDHKLRINGNDESQKKIENCQPKLRPNASRPSIPNSGVESPPTAVARNEALSSNGHANQFSGSFSHIAQNDEEEEQVWNFKRLFIAGPTVSQASDAVITELFSQFGKVERINRIYSRNMTSRQMVYVEFPDNESAAIAQVRHAQNPLYLLGEQIHKVELARPKPKVPNNNWPSKDKFSGRHSKSAPASFDRLNCRPYSAPISPHYSNGAPAVFATGCPAHPYPCSSAYLYANPLAMTLGNMDMTAVPRVAFSYGPMPSSYPPMGSSALNNSSSPPSSSYPVGVSVHNPYAFYPQDYTNYTPQPSSCDAFPYGYVPNSDPRQPCSYPALSPASCSSAHSAR
jgi:hypothetical protein